VPLSIDGKDFVFQEIAIMTIAATLRDYLARQDVEYEVLSHPYSHSSMETAHATQVPGECLAKAVILEDEEGYLMAVLPSTYHIELHTLSERLQRRLKLVTEPDLARLFKDCDPGAIPPVGEAYGMDAIIDERLAAKPDLYFEAGDHRELIHMRGSVFMGMMGKAKVGRFSLPS
jgi:Ala-tRNA(Pro) deacylase